MQLVITCGRKSLRLIAAIFSSSAFFAFGIQHVGAAEPQLEKAIQDGKSIFIHETFGGNGMTCDACHTNGGVGAGHTEKRPTIPSLTNAAAIYPRYEARKNKVITLEQKVQDCVAGALKGTPPTHGSEQMTQLVAYLTFLAQGKPVNVGGKPE